MKKVNYYLQRFNRGLVWLLLPFFIIFIICGYGITNPRVVGELTGGILTRSLSLRVHVTFAFPILMMFMIHILIQLRFALMRLGFKDGMLLNLSIAGLGFLSTILLMLMDRVMI